MAAAFARTLGGERIEVMSAGSEPADAIHPSVLTAMRERGIDLASESPKVLRDDDVRASNIVITMGCGDACPVYPGKRYVDWELDDPAGKSIDVVRAIRDEIEARVRALLRELNVVER
jgi:protein-tyrosine-phosphatase